MGGIRLRLQGRKAARWAVLTVWATLLAAPPVARAEPKPPESGVADPGAAASSSPLTLPQTVAPAPPPPPPSPEQERDLGMIPSVDPGMDAAYGAYQRGLFITAFREATARVGRDPGDAAAMTLLGELHAAGLGVRQDWTRAAEWFRLAADRGDPHAAYGLAMLEIDGRGVPKNVADARRLLERSADAVPAAATSLGLMLLGDQRPESDRRAVELFRSAAEALDPDALYAMAVLTRQGRGTEKDASEAALWMGKAASERNIAAQVEYGIMLFNGDGIRKDEPAAARMFTRAAVRGNAVAQNRLARLYAAGRGVQKNVVEAAKWHELAKLQGLPDTWLDGALKDMSPDEKKKAADAVNKIIGDQF